MAKNMIALVFHFILAALAILMSAAAVYFAWFRYYSAAYPIEYGEIVAEQSLATNVPESLLFAVIRTESGFDSNAQSHASARGLMQITQDTFEWAQFRIKEEADLSFDDLYDHEINIRYGAEILRLLLDEFGSENNALCAYHAGWGSVKRWLDNPQYTVDGEVVNIPFGDTRRYVEKVLKTQEIYNDIYRFERN